MALSAQSFDAVLEITFNRPESLNAINGELVQKLSDQLDSAAADDKVRAVMLRGEGRAFCSGGDIGFFMEVIGKEGYVSRQLPDALHAMIEKVRAVPKPIIAAVHGPCAGAGFALVLACDLAVASDNATFNMAYTAIGLSPDGSSTYFLPRHVGMKRATELFLFPRNMAASEALELGLINRVVPAAELLEQARALTQKVAAGPTVAYGRVKELLDATWTNSLHDQLDLESEHLSNTSRTEDFREGITAFLGKRKPKFNGR